MGCATSLNGDKRCRQVVCQYSPSGDVRSDAALLENVRPPTVALPKLPMLGSEQATPEEQGTAASNSGAVTRSVGSQSRSTLL